MYEHAICMLLHLQYYCLEITWCEDFSPECMFPKTIAPFRISCGTYTSNKARENPLQVFLLFFTLVLLETIVTQTNMMAAKKGVTLGLCIEELQAFIGMNIAMGMLRLPQIRDYWATDEVLSTPWFPSIMPRDRFFQIMRFLHLVDS